MTRKILAVDDEPEILNLFNTFLDFKGYQVRTATNANDCLKQITADPPELILLDVNMPGIDGLQLLEMIKTDPNSKYTPVIMISARRDENTIRRAVALGCDNFIVKPFKLQDLAARISAELFNLEFNEVQEILSRLQTPIQFFKGLDGIVQTEYSPDKWDGYLTRHDERELCVLVSRGIRPIPLAKLDEEELRTKVNVFHKKGTRWRKVWPRSGSSES